MDKNLYTISTERCKHFELGKAEWMKDIQTAAIQSPLPPHPTHLTSTPLASKTALYQIEGWITGRVMHFSHIHNLEYIRYIIAGVPSSFYMQPVHQASSLTQLTRRFCNDKQNFPTCFFSTENVNNIEITEMCFVWQIRDI